MDWLAVKRELSLAGNVLAPCMGVPGLFITFVPGSEAVWFGIATGMAAIGVLSSSWPLKAFALAQVLLYACASGSGVSRWLHYQDMIQHRLPL